MDFKLKGKTALVTGGTHGIGRAIAIALADEGANVVVCSRTKERVDKTRGELEAKGIKCLSIVADVTVEADIERVMAETLAKFGTLHILVNNVGGGGRWGKENIEATDERVWTEVYEKNVLSAIRFTMRALPLMRAQKWGRVITITSILGREGGGRPWFCMAKAAQTSFMKNMAKAAYLAKDGITFNSVAPGAIMIPDTGWEKELKEKTKEIEEFVSRELPLGRFGTPEEVAGLVAFLCSESASLVNGASIPVDGGQSKSML